MSFKELGIKEDFIKGLTEMGINTPTEIQNEAIPYLLNNNKDFIGLAQTGTGKTLAFGLPVLQRINPTSDKLQTIILSPTRELCKQIAKQLFKYTKYSDKIFTEAVYGGEKIDIQKARLNRTTHVIVATPGRLLDLLHQKIINLDDVKTVVLDEADEMLSMGFKKELNDILDYAKGRKNIWLFSATMPVSLKNIISNYMSLEARTVEINKGQKVNASIMHQYAVVDDDKKLEALLNFFKTQKGERGIVFCRTKAAADLLCKQLKAKNKEVDVIHGDLKQIERDKVMRAFKGDKLETLIATDISARGIDVADLAYVVHYQLPDQIEYFTHRSGRTGRAGKKGLSICLINNKEINKLKAIERELKLNIGRVS